MLSDVVLHVPVRNVSSSTPELLLMLNRGTPGDLGSWQTEIRCITALWRIA